MYTNDAVIRVRYGETDQMGVVYHGNYYTWFEVGRSEFFNSLGYTYKRLEEEGIILPVIESSCQYIKPAKYYDEIIIRTRVDSLKGVRIAFSYEVIRKEDDILLARGKTTHGFVNKELKPVKFKKVNREVWDILENCIR
ncbi:acyl-CoA thioesterase [Paramaledivibacter caminithermalis]|jgi:acyl-CoA thioester hydrolase|uniref:Acyl-CoA thioester hydrolase n=1 Tax=Paramaledivibacter caminithermalis (strain DSM 15212 / CIP 107654 / DViRD3) TaxID=1121301 RepID=A0A1M6TRZ1_PARC5|nr:thioesterase family protein [Paramaledivibacter caminithermalis]SHK59663.1 acyl-CoA thioester hydrolase [Paramaledivibacter caminithermalis DSM 15212]